MEKEIIGEFEEILNKIKMMSEAIDLHNDVKTAVSNEEIDYNYLRYIENSLEKKLFSNTKVEGIMPKVLLEVVCPDLINIDKFDDTKLIIENIGSHFEEQENYIDKVCMYNGEFVSIFGISELHPNKVIKYDLRKFTRADMIEAIRAQYKEGQKVTLYQYDEYYVVHDDEEKIKVFTPRKVTALVKVEETIFDRIKAKIAKLFIKPKSYPDMELVYDSNPVRFEKTKYKKSKYKAIERMEALLNKERELTREQ